MKKETGIIVLTISSIIIAISLLLLVYQNNVNKHLNIEEKKDKEISLLKKNIDTLKEDKDYYKKLYLETIDDYQERLHSLGIDEIILTDTSR